MSITVRLWSKDELESTKKDKWLATILMNCNTLSQEQVRYYPYNQRRTYVCWWGDEPEAATIYATDERMLLKFIDAEHTKRPDSIYQQILQYRPIKAS